MNTLLIYTGKVAVLLAVFYLLYKSLLSRETLHRLNRRVLAGTLFLSAMLPLCVFTIHKTVEVQEAVQQAQIPAGEISGDNSAPAGVADTATGFSNTLHDSTPWWLIMLFFVYLSGVMAVLAHTAVSATRLLHLVRTNERHYDEGGQEYIVLDSDIAPFSWMRWIVLSRSDFESRSDFVIAHEKAHLAFGHSKEVLLAEVFCAMQWFNPAAWLLKSELRAIHEYEADDAVLRGGADIKAYQYSLIKKAVGASGYSITNSFHHSILKNRITMMSKSKSRMSRGWKILYILPVALCFLAVNAQTVTDYKSSENSSTGETSYYGIALPGSTAPIEKRTEQVFFKMTKGDTVADTLFLYMRLFAPEELDGLYAYGPIWHDNLPAALKGSYYLISIDAEPQCPMGLIFDLRNEVWQQGIWRVRYTCAGSGDMAYAMLPKTRGESQMREGYQGDSEDSARPLTNHRLLINKDGRFRFDGKNADENILEDAVSNVIRSEPTRYLITLLSDRATPYNSFVRAQSIVEQSLSRLRNEYAQARFGLPFDENLTEEQYVETVNALPKRISAWDPDSKKHKP